MVVGTGLASLVRDPWQFVLLYGVVAGVGYAGSGVLPVSVHVTRWFPGERGFVMALAAAGFSLGHLVFTQVAAHAAATLGWRRTYGMMAAILLGFLAAFVVWLRDAPAARPGGAAAAPRPEAAPRPAPDPRPSLDRRAALGTRGFWAMTVGLMGCGFTDFLMTTHLPPFATDLGLSPVVAANAVSLWAAANVVGILAAGAVATRIGARPALVGTYALRATALFLLLAVREPWHLYLFAVLFGATFFTTAPLSSTLVGALFGPRHHGAIFGTANLFHHTAGALGSYAGGLAYDVTRSYIPVFLAGALIVVGSATVTSLARWPREGAGSREPA
jgi:MFS family permease